MIGIYLITNMVNKKVYVGQSLNIEKRYKEHLRSGQPDKYSIKNERDTKTPIHLAMQKYGVENFQLRVLELCDKESLNEKEKQWIKYYKAKDFSCYNIADGGQDSFALKGEYHSQAKLSQKDVDEIKRLIKQGTDFNSILKIFPFISKSSLSMINQGKTWFDEREKYPLRKMSTARKGSLNGRAKFTEEQVKEIRERYSQGESPASLKKEFGKFASESAISSILYGKSYKYLPIWSNTKKKWIEPCIDYSQSLK